MPPLPPGWPDQHRHHAPAIARATSNRAAHRTGFEPRHQVLQPCPGITPAGRSPAAVPHLDAQSGRLQPRRHFDLAPVHLGRDSVLDRIPTRHCTASGGPSTPRFRRRGEAEPQPGTEPRLLYVQVVLDQSHSVAKK